VEHVLRNHVRETLACDFFVVVTATLRPFYVFLVLEIGRRRILHLHATDIRPPSGRRSNSAYMLRGDKGASNTDPFAMGPATNNNWVVTPAHIMVLSADAKTLDMYPTDPKASWGGLEMC
jgi:hypothetical protein